MTADLEPVARRAQMVGVVNHPGREPEHLPLERLQQGAPFRLAADTGIGQRPALGLCHACGSSTRSLTEYRTELGEGATAVTSTKGELEQRSGLELIDYLRFSPDSPNRLLPVIMLTAHSEQEYVVAARDKGVTEFLAKPFTVDGLYRRLSSVIARPRAFVNAQSYFGPDRRRRHLPHRGPNRPGAHPA